MTSQQLHATESQIWRLSIPLISKLNLKSFSVHSIKKGKEIKVDSTQMDPSMGISPLTSLINGTDQVPLSNGATLHLDDQSTLLPFPWWVLIDSLRPESIYI
jgi:hypothetical protein